MRHFFLKRCGILILLSIPQPKFRKIIYCGVNIVQTIYVDILLSLNLVINYLLLSASAFYTHTKVSLKRLLLGSAIGSICSLIMLLPVIPFVLNMLIKFLVGGITVFVCFGRKNKKEFIKLYAVFLTATFFFGGIVISLWFLFTPKNLMIKNSVIYINISPVSLILYSVICYLAFRFIHIIIGKYRTKETFCILTIISNNHALRVNAKIDTGNTLTEPFSQCPVIVVGRSVASPVTPIEILEYETVTSLSYRTQINSIRFVPFTSVGGKGILPCFKAEKIYINDALCDKNVYIALCNDEYIKGDFQALVPYEIT